MQARSLPILIVLASCALAIGAQRNEGSRISIKRATDVEATKISAKAEKTTIEEMLNQTRPEGLEDMTAQGYQTRRAGKFETTKWVVEATITEVIKRPDGDFYCVIEGANGGKTVFEAPDPELCAGSHFLDEIKKVRKALADKFHPTPERQKVNIKVQVTGLGFFGYQSKTPSGTKTNGARLMPVLDIKLTK